MHSFIWGSFIHNGDRKTLLLCICPLKYLNELLISYQCILDNTILLISALSMLIGHLFLWKKFLITQSS